MSKAKRNKMTEKDIIRNRVLNAIMDSRLARNPVIDYSRRKEYINEEKPIQSVNK